ncbi:glucose-1-phosphate adenylyltransferase [Acetitomaculum ruminis DSM 5522]|uniref:Glucose-1-phosphate adenylyltransferase n=1 Tax=Acetitomaculum ruminis DSM 5522 TaxID=1120918 RepID=A0A1I0WYX5_9FIRM|nr:glucose-1-phosphate adenylyltransferase subunit GlgD [Acetitomaculum ruminis]SFA93851.1 glucose-1-phosphate adenylyltransferase [Acetitomaculum ruminis DSM 5522]
MNAIGLILAGGNSFAMRELTDKRATAAMPVAGGYRSIDFVLSNMTNSGVKTVAVLTQYNARSLNEHLSSSKWWNFGRKQGGLFVFNPTITKENTMWYRGTADCMYQNLDFLLRRHEPYVIVANGNCLYKMDYGKVIDYHISKGADITVVCKELPGNTDFSRFGVIKTNETKRIIEFEEKPMMAHSRTVSIGVYVIRRRLLIELLQRSIVEGRYDFVNDIIIRYKNLKKIYAYEMEGYWSNISTVEAYYQANMDFLKEDVRSYFFNESPYIFSKSDDMPPAKYNPGAVVRNSLVASGCIINGTVENSVLFKKVFVGTNCVIKNSIVLNDVYLGDNSHFENCIVESRGTMIENAYHIGSDEIKVVIEKNDRYIL